MKIQFSAEGTPVVSDQFVTRAGKMFEVGKYPDKKFELSTADMDAVCRDFKPVSLGLFGEKPTAKLNVGHRPSIFDLGELGHISRVWHDGKEMFADVSLDKDIDAYFKKHNITATVSAEWDIPSKQLIGLALEHNPYFQDAAIYAAFSKDPETFARSAVASMHDSSVYNGAECGGKSLFSDAAQFMTSDELKTLQKVHDMCTGDGKHCDAMASRNAMYSASADPTPKPRTRKDEKQMTYFERMLAKFRGAGVPDKEATEAAAFAAAAHKESGENIASFSQADMDAAREATKKELRAEFAEQMATRDAQIQTLNANFAEDRSKATFAASEAAVTQLKRDCKLTAAEGAEYLAMAKDNPAAFAVVLPVLQKRTPLAQFGGPVQRIAPTPDSPTAQFNAKVQEYADKNKVSFGQAAKAVAQQDPQLAQAHFATTSIAVGGVSEGDN